MTLRPMKTSNKHEDFLRALQATIPPDMDSLEILAIASQFVGQLSALQDQRLYRPGAIYEIIWKNVQTGNEGVVQSLAQSAGSKPDA